MSAFNKIIGYETIKSELLQICDMFNHKQKYEKADAKLLTGILIYGAQGTGKTTMAECFLEECGANCFLIDRSVNSYKIAEELPKIFAEAKENAPAVIFIDDFDSIFDEECYNKLQAEIDNSQNSVLVIATAKDIDKIPESLLRAGRFGRKIEICLPTEQERDQIIKHYLTNKKTKDINYEDLIMMCADFSCADIKAIINDAAINAVASNRKEICMKDFVEVCLRREYVSPDFNTSVSEEDLRRTALHEAGHLVISEILCPGGVGIVSVRDSGKDTLNGFVWNCKPHKRRAHDIIVSLGGKAAIELYHAETCASGCYTDIRKAFRNIRQAMAESGTCGLGMIDVDMWNIGMSENMNSRSEAVVHAEMEKYMFKAKDILLKNREFLEKATALLLEKRTLLHSDIKALKESVTITDVAV